MTRSSSRVWLTGLAVAIGALVFTTGPVYRVRTWWGYADPLAADVAVVVVQVVVGLIAVLALVSQQRWKSIDRGIIGIAGALVIWMAIGSIWSASPSTTLRESLLIGVTLIAGMGAAAAASERALVVASWVGVHLGLCWSAMLIATVQPGSQDANGEWTGVYFNPNSLALVAAFGIFLSIVAALLLFAHARRMVVLAVLAAAILADLWLISGTGALTPLFALVAGLALAALAVLGRRLVGPEGRRPVDGRVVAGVAGVALVCVGTIAWLTRGTWLPWVGRTSDLTGRTAMWDVALDWFGNRPLVGHGYLGAWFDAEFAAQMLVARGEVLGSAHNSFIDLLLGTGLIGTALVLALFGSIWVMAGDRALSNEGWIAAWPLAALGFLIVENLAETLWVAGQLSVAVLGVLAVVSTAKPQPASQTPDVGVVTEVVGVQGGR